MLRKINKTLQTSPGFEVVTYRNSQDDVGLLVLASVGWEHEHLVHGHVSQPDVVLGVDGDL